MFDEQKGKKMYTEIHEWQEFNQKVLYFKLNNTFNLQIDSELNHKIFGIYAIFKDNICLYVGQSSNLASRVATHLKGKYNSATDIFIWNVENIGFSDFKSRNKESQKSILDNCEKYVMSKLKPIENIAIDMDFKLTEDATPVICFESNSCITILINEQYLLITDYSSYHFEDKNVDIDYLEYCGALTREQSEELKSRGFVFGIHTKGVKND